ncbi:Ig-like domain-containing protein [Leucobacter rhizosphaerae]|uniref:Ig-like domain-containing protein n=1 Tax=Leucobacter rhizosphaerae TaxID=2932245 RepID=A0ABY4FUF0_9MICO|nr:Ig-like domain-containing protein [Leucobacter rhizosphaerae]UOQ59895.1 Ig-like domain-containing protein [Leucobacter rhizosphaerae]
MAGRTGSGRSRLVSWLAGGVSLAVLATIAVVAAGYDAREAPRDEPSVWAMRSSGQYARVNTLTAEIDTVRAVDEPSGLLQSGSRGVVLSHGGGRAWTIDPTLPVDLLDAAGSADDAAADAADAEGAGADAADAAAQPVSSETADPAEGGTPEAAMRTPSGTRDTVAAGDAVLFRTDEGEVFLSTFADPGSTAASGPAQLSAPVRLDPGADAESDDAASGEAEQGDAESGDSGTEDDDAAGTGTRADAVAVDEDGRVALFSSDESRIFWYDIDRAEFTGAASEVPAAVPAEGVQLAIVDGAWVLFEPGEGRLWIDGIDEPVSIDTDDSAKLQASSTEAAGAEILIADRGGLWRVLDGEAERVADAEGVPAQPVAVAGDRVAAWIGQETAALWDGEEVRELALDDTVSMPGDPDPVIRTSGSHALLSEVKTGMLWTVPDGTLIPVQQWSQADPPQEEDGSVVVLDVTEQEPPVAVPDDFGVRAGEPALLPVLLNDYDPNRRDVLTIVSEGLGEGFPAEFGEVDMLADGQGLVIRPTVDASGSATFVYRITDGFALSEPATVTVTVADPDTNTAPAWCPVEGCQRSWPNPELAPGGTLVMPILEGWVDPEGDPLMLADATPVNAEDPVRALVTADGRLALRHTDPNAPDSDLSIRLTVADAQGAATERELQVSVRSNAQAEIPQIASTVQVGQAATLRPLTRVTGGSGSYALVDAAPQSGTAEVTMNAGAGTVEVRAREAGSSIIALTVRDTGTDAEITGTMRVTAVDARARLGLPPLRAFVRPLTDTTVEVLDAVPGSGARALVVDSANVRDGELRADVIEHARVRVSGATADGAPGRIGSIDVGIAEGEQAATGRLTVFQVPDSGAEGAIAVADTATVRAGSVVDIPVLQNDVAPPGQRLVLHPEIEASGAAGELAFASGNTLRYLAPREAGVYTLSYTTYGASSPESSDVGHVRVTVLPREGNRDPQPPTVTVRLAPGELATAAIPLTGVDPDGDRVRLVGVGTSADPQLTATLAPRSSTVQIEASKRATAGVQLIDYTVRDEFGGEGTGSLRVIVTAAAAGSGAPVTYSDYVRLTTGADDPAVVRPLDNDIDPMRGTLELLEVVPNVPGGSDGPEYRQLADRLDLSGLAQGRVSVRGSDEPGTVSYRYTARSSQSSSTADGLIVVQTSARVGQQAPTVKDTVLSARDRVELARGGIDVVTDQVFWAAGDVSALTLSVWGSAADRFRVDGSRIIGEYRAEGDLVPFRLAGKDATGEAVQTFGFLVIPPLDELRLTLEPGLRAITVDEGKSVDVAVADLLDLAAGDTVDLRQTAFPVQRAQAECAATGASQLRYRAGKEAPWTDSCIISVKLTEQKAWTQLAVPIEVVPTEPVVELEPLTRTVAPGASETIALTDMVRWQGGREGSAGALRFQVSGGGQSFEVSPSGAQVTVTANADAVPGTQEPLVVSVSGAGESQSPLTLRVGEAAKDTPRGATVQLNCTVGSACQANVIGAPGEYDPFAGRTGGGLTLASVDGAGCATGSFQVAGDAVAVSWPDPRGAGGKCTASFSVTDAQGRVGTGTIELDAQGVPRAPAGITPTAADANSVTLAVELSGQTAYPAVSGVEILVGGATVASCAPGGNLASCTVTGLTPGEKRTYTARAVNAAGASEPSANGAETWAYVPPESPSISAETVKWPENTDAGTGRVRVTIGESSSASRVLRIDGVETAIPGDGIFALAAGAVHTFSVVAADSIDRIPPGYTGGDGGMGTARQAQATPIGAPRAGSAEVTLSGPFKTDWAFTTNGWGQNGGDALVFTYAIGGYSGPNNSGGGLTPHQEYVGTVTAKNSYGTTGSVAAPPVYTGNKLPTLTGTYEVSATPSGTGWSLAYNAQTPTYTPSPTGTVTFSGVSPGNPIGTVKQCPILSINCSDEGPVTPASLEPLAMTLASCVPWDGTTVPDHATIQTHVSVVGAPGGAFTFEAQTSGDIIVNWAGLRGNGTFTAGLCTPTPPPGP